MSKLPTPANDETLTQRSQKGEELCDGASPSSHLYDLLKENDWEGASTRIASNPVDARYRHKESLGGGSSRRCQNDTPLHLACRRLAPVRLISDLVNTFPDAALSTNSDGRTPLRIACHNFEEDPAAFRVLLAAVPRAALVVDNVGRNLVHDGCWNSRIDVDAVLDVVNAVPESSSVQDKYGYTPLHLAVNNRAVPKLVRALLGACPEATSMGDTADEWTPLHHSCAGNGSDAVTKVLIEANVDVVFAKNKLNQTPFELLCASHRVRLKTMPAFPSSFDEVERTLWNKLCHVVRATYHGSVSKLPPHGGKWQMLHACFGINCPYQIRKLAVKYLPEQMRETDSHGNLPLHIAAAGLVDDSRLPSDENEAESTLQLMIQIHPDAVGVRNLEGRIPLEVALDGRDEWTGSATALFKASFQALVDMRIMEYPPMLFLLSSESPPSCLFELLKEVPFIMKGAHPE